MPVFWLHSRPYPPVLLLFSLSVAPFWNIAGNITTRTEVTRTEVRRESQSPDSELNTNLAARFSATVVMQTETRYDSRMETDHKYHEEYDVMSGIEDLDFGVDDNNGPLLPFPEHHLTSQKSAPRAIPKAQSLTVPNQGMAPPSASQPSSAGSTASAFLNNLMDPAASTFNSTHFSHTPPSQISTSYEASHFAKRARSGVRE